MGWFKINKKPGKTIDAGFRKATGMRYLGFLEALHNKWKPDWYLEIGTETGRSLAFARGNAIAIDPEFKITANLHYPSQLHFFQLTSDDFFANGFMDRNSIRLDLSFLDGMHLFEFLLRDFINVERASNPSGLITVHDCVPFNRIMAQRNWDKAKSHFWTGDVWKLLPILKRHRPDLNVEMLDCAPTGLVLISGLDPENSVLEREYESIVAEWKDVTLDDFGLERFASEFPFVSAESCLAKMGLS